MKNLESGTRNPLILLIKWVGYKSLKIVTELELALANNYNETSPEGTQTICNNFYALDFSILLLE